MRKRDRRGYVSQRRSCCLGGRRVFVQPSFSVHHFVGEVGQASARLRRSWTVFYQRRGRRVRLGYGRDALRVLLNRRGFSEVVERGEVVCPVPLGRKPET